MDLQVPAELRESWRERDRVLDLRALAEMAHEVEARAAESLRIEALELGVVDRRRNERNAAIVAALRGDRIGDHAIVVAVTGGLNDHAVPDAEQSVQCEQLFLGRIGGREGAVLREGKNPVRPEHVHVRIAGTGRQLQFRPAG